MLSRALLLRCTRWASADSHARVPFSTSAAARSDAHSTEAAGSFDALLASMGHAERAAAPPLPTHELQRLADLAGLELPQDTAGLSRDIGRMLQFVAHVRQVCGLSHAFSRSLFCRVCLLPSVCVCLSRISC